MKFRKKKNGNRKKSRNDGTLRKNERDEETD